MAIINNNVVKDVKEFIRLNIKQWRKEAKGYDGLELTMAINEDGSCWNYQTGDNSYTGSAYGLPHWAVVTIQSDSTIKELCQEIFDQWNELLGD